MAVFVTDADRFLRDEAWIGEIGPHVLSSVEPTAIGLHLERRILFADGRDVDLAFMPAEAAAAAAGLPEIAGVLRRGARVLLDRDGLLGAALRRPAAVPDVEPPTDSEYGALVRDVLYHVLWIARKLARGELWVAVTALDGYLAERLLRMVEWQARAAAGGSLDTWHEGRFLEHWAPHDVVAALAGVFARYRADDVAESLVASHLLFRRLATDVAARLGYEYPLAADRRIEGWVRELVEPLTTAPSAARGA